jgi:two-component system, OmpR family, sensor kinase
MSPFRSVGSRLAVALVLVVAVALGVAWFVVVPSLERNLTKAKLDQQANRARVAMQTFPAFTFENPAAGPQVVSDWASEKGAITNTRVVVFHLLSREPDVQLDTRADSRQDIVTPGPTEDRIARSAALYGRISRGVVTYEGQRYTEVALPVREVDAVVLFSSSLEDTVASVSQVKRRLLIAGGLAMGIALALGYGAASVFARRIRRLERAADRIAGGRLDEPVVDRGRDELGQLADAFERMRTQLARLDHARREFIANASHELRTPIFALGGFLELMASEEIDEATRREFMATMQEQLARLEKLATDLLDLTRLDAGQLSLDLETIDLGRVAEALAEEFAAVAVSTEHPIRIERLEERVEAVADETRTLQIGRALLENAIRHTPEGTAIRLTARRHDGAAVLAVEDSGPGIAATAAGQIFERFRRGDSAHASGSGLGLAIARELADAMGGRVELQSVSGKTVFRLALPAAPSAAPEPAAQRAS